MEFNSIKVKGFLLKSEQPDNMDAIHEVTGYAVSLLLKSGKPVRMNDITIMLKQHEEQSTGSLKQTYAAAIRIIANKMN